MDERVKQDNMRMQIYHEVHELLLKVGVKKRRVNHKIYVTTSIDTSEISNCTDRIIKIIKEHK